VLTLFITYRTPVFGFNLSLKKSPKIFIEKEIKNMAAVAEANSHQQPLVKSRLAESSIVPQLGCDLAPNPRKLSITSA
jgi:hypothetical protein